MEQPLTPSKSATEDLCRLARALAAFPPAPVDSGRALKVYLDPELDDVLEWLVRTIGLSKMALASRLLAASMRDLRALLLAEGVEL
jgi:hypothetical protein